MNAMRAPLMPALRDAFLLPALDCIPFEYVELLAYTNAFQFNGWNFPGLPLDEFAMDGPNHFRLAESSEFPYQLHAVDGDSERNVYLYDVVDDEGSCLGGGFLSALAMNQRRLRRRCFGKIASPAPAQQLSRWLNERHSEDKEH